ncbi:putative phage tail protein [Lacrimispora sp.]|uniref:putative phage tail protein n=1 Tax=Lacrimispora sp. TaxID=2719234 RepID=UPI0039927E69
MMLPEWFKDIIEFNRLLETEEIELEDVENSLRTVRNNCFIQTADENTISLYEKRLGLSSGSTDLEERRKMVFSRLNRKVPYSMEYLKRLLSLWVGEENYSIDTSRFAVYVLGLNIKEQTLTVLHDIIAEVRNLVPAHMILDFYGRYQGDYGVPVSKKSVIHFRMAFYPRYNLPYLFLDNTWILDRKQRLNGYNAEELLDFYPVGIRIQTEISEPIQQSDKLRISTGIKAQGISSVNGLKSGIKVKEEVHTAECLTIITGVEKQITSGLQVMNRNVVDGDWTLNGNRRLNGGLSIL